jgi:MFS superfamily sulfate permease-like transporter
MLIASSINGFLFGLVSGQPLLILGPTGPFLVFEEMVYDVNRKQFFLYTRSLSIYFDFSYVNH